MNIVDKIIYGVFAAFVVGALLYYAWLYNKNQKQAAEIAHLETRLAECGLRTREAEAAIDRQNAAIETARVDTVEVVKKVQAVAGVYASARAEVEQRLEKDDGCENRMDIIDGLMRGFHGVRAECRNEN